MKQTMNARFVKLAKKDGMYVGFFVEEDTKAAVITSSGKLFKVVNPAELADRDISLILDPVSRQVAIGKLPSGLQQKANAILAGRPAEPVKAAEPKVGGVVQEEVENKAPGHREGVRSEGNTRAEIRAIEHTYHQHDYKGSGNRRMNRAELTGAILARIEVVVKKIQEGKPLTQEEREMQRKYGLGTTAMYKRAEKLARNPISRSLDKHPSKRVNRAEATSAGGEAGATEPDTSGKIGIIFGVNSDGFTGGFVPQEINFIKTIIYQKNVDLEGKQLDFDKASTRLLNGNDVHLFCGHSDFGTTRIDIRKEYPHKIKGSDIPEMRPTMATKNVLVNDFMSDAIKRGKQYDLVIIDPPYNAKFDKEYETYQYNGIDDENVFFADLVERCVKIVAPDGIIVSKNWRNARPAGFKWVAGALTKSGGFRRVTIIEAWQKAPSKVLDFPWQAFAEMPTTKVDKLKGKKKEGNVFEMVKWYIGHGGKWVKAELAMMAKHVDIGATTSGIIITDPAGSGEAKPVKLGNLTSMTVNEFLADNKKHDVILLDECKGVGGDTPKTSALKEHLTGYEEHEDNKAVVAWQHRIYNHAVQSLKRGGFVFTKTYFDPKLEDMGMVLLDKRVTCTDYYGKVGLFVLYQKA